MNISFPGASSTPAKLLQELERSTHLADTERTEFTNNRIHSRSALFDDEEGADGEGVDAGAIEGADGGARIGDERFAEEVEAGVDEDGGGSGFAEFVEQAPEAGIGFAVDGVNADGVAVEGEAFEAREGFFEGSVRCHETAVGAAIEIFAGAFGGDGKREGMEFFAVLN